LVEKPVKTPASFEKLASMPAMRTISTKTSKPQSGNFKRSDKLLACREKDQQAGSLSRRQKKPGLNG
jgi:hypothetical protein